MPKAQHIHPLPGAADTDRLGKGLARHLGGGDTLLLSGPIGAGKTHFARAAIQSLLPQLEDIPSPTFTLVQTYDTTAGPLWHADLYRLADSSEVDELGLIEAMHDAICLIEWPDRLPYTPQTVLELAFDVDGAGRAVTLTWTDARWDDRIAEVLSLA